MELGDKVHLIPVIIEIDLKKVIARGARRQEAMDPNTIRQFVTEGMRGQLQTESLVTGVPYVGFDFFQEPRCVWSSRRVSIFNTMRYQPSPRLCMRPRMPLPGLSRNLTVLISKHWQARSRKRVIESAS